MYVVFDTVGGSSWSNSVFGTFLQPHIVVKPLISAEHEHVYDRAMRCFV